MKKLDSYSELIEPFFKRVDIYTTVANFTNSRDFMPHALMLLYSAHFCLSEIYNGNLLQFFWNHTGILAPEAIEGFIALGMPKLAETLASATDLLGEPYPRDRDERWVALLQASGRDEEELKQLFSQSDNLYSAFVSATEPLGLGQIGDRAWELAQNENGGFQLNAMRYAEGLV